MALTFCLRRKRRCNLVLVFALVLPVLFPLFMLEFYSLDKAAVEQQLGWRHSLKSIKSGVNKADHNVLRQGLPVSEKFDLHIVDRQEKQSSEKEDLHIVDRQEKRSSEKESPDKNLNALKQELPVSEKLDLHIVDRQEKRSSEKESSDEDLHHLNVLKQELPVSKKEDNIGKTVIHLVADRLEEQSSERDSECLKWVKLAPKPPYFLTAVLLVRIYEKDKAKLTTAELKMWLQYLRYAGVEHVYIYDAWLYSNESQLSKLSEFVKDGYITYVDWHTHNPYTISMTQVTAYQNCIDVYKEETQWQTAIDIDEYPFSPVDQSPGFLYRYMKHLDENYSQISEVSMQNFLFLGKPLDKELMIERLMRRTPHPHNNLVKPIYKPKNVRASIHHNSVRKGRSMNAPVTELRMNHYWGARLQDWGEDTAKILSMTKEDKSTEPIINAFKLCKEHVHHYL